MAIVATILVLALTANSPASTKKGNLNPQLSGWCPWSSWECNKALCFNARRRRCLCAKLYTLALPNVSSVESLSLFTKSRQGCHADSQAMELSASRCNPITLCYLDTIAWHPSLPGWCPWFEWTTWHYQLDAAGCRSKERRRRRHCGCPQSSSTSTSCVGPVTSVERWHQEHEDSRRQTFCRPGPARWCSWQPVLCKPSSASTSCSTKTLRRQRLCECPPPQSNEDMCQGNSTELINCTIAPQICQDLSLIAGDLKVASDVDVAYPFGLKMFFVLCALLLFLTVLLILRHRRSILEHRAAARHAQMIMRLETCVRPNEITCRLTSPDFDSHHYLSEAPPRYDEVVHEMYPLPNTPPYHQFVEDDLTSTAVSASTAPTTFFTVTADGSVLVDETSQSLLQNSLVTS